MLIIHFRCAIVVRYVVEKMFRGMDSKNKPTIPSEGNADDSGNSRFRTTNVSDKMPRGGYTMRMITTSLIVKTPAAVHTYASSRRAPLSKEPSSSAAATQMKIEHRAMFSTKTPTLGMRSDEDCGRFKFEIPKASDSVARKDCGARKATPSFRVTIPGVHKSGVYKRSPLPDKPPSSEASCHIQQTRRIDIRYGLSSKSLLDSGKPSIVGDANKVNVSKDSLVTTQPRSSNTWWLEYLRGGSVPYDKQEEDDSK